MPARLSPFSTFVVGSLPRPQWLREVILDRKAGRLTGQAADELIDAAIPSAIRLQERAGVEFISDGEWRRESYIKVISEHVDGFAVDAMASLAHTVSDPAVVKRMSPREPLALNGARFLRSHTKHRTIVTLPSPYILGWRMWHPGLSRGAYPTRLEFMEACVPILRAEVESLFAEGVDHVQIDEPWLLMLVDPEHRARVGMSDIAHEIETCVAMINGVVPDGSAGSMSMHLCHGHFGRKRYSVGGYEPIIEALGEVKVGRIAMEFAAPESQGVEVLKRFPARKTLGLGVIDHCDPRIETTERIVERVEAALKFVPPDRMTLNPDCGFSPGSQNPMDLDEAYLKLGQLARAAQFCKERHAS